MTYRRAIDIGYIGIIIVVALALGVVLGAFGERKAFRKCHEFFVTTDSATVIRLLPDCEGWK